MFMFFKRTIKEATKLNTEPAKILAELAPVFKKCLRGYAHGCLTAFLPKPSPCSVSFSSQSPASLLQSLLRDGEAVRLSKDEQFLTCCLLATADWCAETSQQLQEKLKEKTANVDMNAEMDVFYNVSSAALLILVHDLETGCQAALQTMPKINWASVQSVGDESPYVSSIVNHLRRDVPSIRDYLSDRRKYFGHLCLKFASQFMAKYLGALFRCRPMSVTGAEQLLLDTHSLKTFLLALPCVQSTAVTKPPTAYVKMINKVMVKAEMVLKIVMSDIDSPEVFVQNYAKLLPESDASELQKVLEMKAVRRTDQVPLLDLYRNRFEYGKTSEGTSKVPAISSQFDSLSGPLSYLDKVVDGDSRIKKLERLVKMKL